MFVVGDAYRFGAQGSQFEEQFVREVVQNEDLENISASMLPVRVRPEKRP